MAFLVVLLRTSLQKAPFYRLTYYILVNNTKSIVGSSTVTIERVIDRYFFIIIFVKLNNKFYTFCCCILDYDDNIIFDLNVSYVSFLMIFLTVSNQPKKNIAFIFQF